MSEVRVVAWRSIERAVDKVVELVHARRFTPSTIIALGRGGLAPAAMIAHRLEVRTVHAWPIRLSDGQQVDTIHAAAPPAVPFTEPVLLVDDLIDTGATVAFARGVYSRAKVAVLFQKPSRVTADFFGFRSDGAEWLRFPWETK